VVSEAPPAEAVLLDLDGVLYVEEEALPGAQDAVARLRAAGLALRYVTNTTARSRSETLEKLRRLGFEVADGELLTPAALAVEHCRARGLERVSLLVGDELVDDFPGLERDERGPQAVIVGDLGESFDYAVLNRAFRHSLAGAELVALQKNRFWRRADGLSLDVGPFVAALEYATGQTAHVVGKPASGFFHGVLDGVGCAPDAAVMVGDDVETDVGGALSAGLRAVLVRTGKFRPEAVEAAGVTPTATLDSIAAVPAWLGA
jgi:phospholysine phosphohistidine inorganic pyrophosphate phosphatase